MAAPQMYTAVLLTLLPSAIAHAQQTIDLRHNQTSHFWEHQIGPSRAIHTDLDKLPRLYRALGQVKLDVVVTTTGHVSETHAVEGPRELFAEAEAIERERTYRPFTDAHGHLIQARIQDAVDILPAEKWRTPREPFPTGINLASLSITLERTACYGTCPIYTVTVHGDGRIDYNGENFVHVKGKQTAQIAPEKLHALLDEFRRADFFSALPQYTAPVTDMPSENIVFQYNGKTRRVDLYAPGMAGAPDSIASLPALIDQAAGAERWVGKGN